MGIYYNYVDEKKKDNAQTTEKKEINEKKIEQNKNNRYKDILNFHVINAIETHDIDNVILLSKEGDFIASSDYGIEIYNKEQKLIKSYQKDKINTICLINENLLVYNNKNDLIFLSINNFKEIQIINKAHEAKRITKIIKGRNEKEIISLDLLGTIKFWNKKSQNFEISETIKVLNGKQDEDDYNKFYDLLLINNILLVKNSNTLFSYDLNNNNKNNQIINYYNKKIFWYQRNLKIIDKKNKIFAVVQDHAYIYKLNDNNMIQLCTIIHSRKYCEFNSVCLFMNKYILVGNNVGNLFILNSKNYQLIKKLYITHQSFEITELTDNTFAAYGSGEIIFWKA